MTERKAKAKAKANAKAVALDGGEGLGGRIVMRWKRVGRGLHRRGGWRI